ncbi:MAG: type VI secretion system tube protein Hcp [Nitrospiraceae bacterium]|nr:type VI secretion system tube protein Hcp [Nitrospiraceae bacterium]
MRMKQVTWALLFLVLNAVAAEAAPEFYVSVTGAIQGPFKGELVNKGFEGKFAGLSFDYEVVSPRDAASGLASGKRQHKPIRIKKPFGPASVQFYAALTKNESLSVVMDFMATDQSGVMVLDHTIKLTNASVASVKMHSDKDVVPAGPANDVIEFTFQQIEITDHRSKLRVGDAWFVQ